MNLIESLESESFEPWHAGFFEVCPETLLVVLILYRVGPLNPSEIDIRRKAADFGNLPLRILQAPLGCVGRCQPDL